MSQVSLDLSAIAANQDGVPEPISSALSALQTGHNDTDTKLTNTVSGHNHDGSNSRALTLVQLPASTLGHAEITSGQYNNASGVLAAVTGLSVTVTVPAGGRRVKITAFAGFFSTNFAGEAVDITIWDGTVGSGTQLSLVSHTPAVANYRIPGTAIAVVTPAAGSKTYNVGLSGGAHTHYLTSNAAYPAFILVELI